MDKPETRSYFLYVLLVILFSICAFIGFKKVLPSRLFSENPVQSPNIVIDSLALAAMNDMSIAPDSGSIEIKRDSSHYEFSSSKNMEGHTYIVNFYEKLYQLEKSPASNKKVRIAYFSDSMTDGDLIVQDIRKQFQQKYGGKGVGFVGITSLSALSRSSITHRYSKNWKTKSFLKSAANRYGIDGQVSYINGSDVFSVEYTASNQPYCERLDKPTLFFGKSRNENAYVNVYINNDSVGKMKLNSTNLLNTLTLTTQNPQNLKLDFLQADSIPFYGLNFDDGKGVHIDNFSMRGNSGLPLSLFDTNLMLSFNKSLHYDLIILHYGANVLNYGTTNYSWYERKMALVVDHLRTCFPNADVLIVSTADKASKQDMEMKTDKAVIPLLLAQKHYAETAGVAFINLYNLMGGENSMVKWVEDKPTMANKDYTHFNAVGSKKIASSIYDEINKGYSNYIRLRKFDE